MCRGLSPGSILSAIWLSPATSEDSIPHLLIETTFMLANIYWPECIRHLTDSYLQFLARHLLRNVTALYTRWWHGIVEATCTATDILEPPIVSSRKKRKGAVFRDPVHLGEHPPSWGRKRRGGSKWCRHKKMVSTRKHWVGNLFCRYWPRCGGSHGWGVAPSKE